MTPFSLVADIPETKATLSHEMTVPMHLTTSNHSPIKRKNTADSHDTVKLLNCRSKLNLRKVGQQQGRLYKHIEMLVVLLWGAFSEYLYEIK